MSARSHLHHASDSMAGVPAHHCATCAALVCRWRNVIQDGWALRRQRADGAGVGRLAAKEDQMKFALMYEIEMPKPWY
ncbi:MAG TPA: hypothetical protein VFE56_13870, partial [Candidatus Binataceae bacterium]|nr:hypothetical protein [Candidatus Binataceae bacterium]